MWEAPGLPTSLPAGHTQAWPQCTQGLWRPLVEEESVLGKNWSPWKKVEVARGKGFECALPVFSKAKGSLEV